SDAISRAPVGRRLLVGAATNWLAFAATLVVGFFLTPYLVRRLGDGPYGLWAFVESVLAYFTLFDLGIAACVVRFVARFHATGDRDELNRLGSTCLALFLGLGLCLFAVGPGGVAHRLQPGRARGPGRARRAGTPRTSIRAAFRGSGDAEAGEGLQP